MILEKTQTAATMTALQITTGTRILDMIILTTVAIPETMAAAAIVVMDVVVILTMNAPESAHVDLMTTRRVRRITAVFLPNTMAEGAKNGNLNENLILRGMRIQDPPLALRSLHLPPVEEGGEGEVMLTIGLHG